MTDAFAEFGFPRRPGIDPDSVHSRYRELAASRHPDRTGGDPDPLGRLNQARRILLSDPLRLRHLIVLEYPGHGEKSPFQPDFALFSRMGKLAASAAAAAERMGRAVSPLADALAAGERRELLESVSSARAELDALAAALAGKIQGLDSRWPEVTAEELEHAAAEAAFLDRWRESLREASVLLLGG